MPLRPQRSPSRQSEAAISVPQPLPLAPQTQPLVQRRSLLAGHLPLQDNRMLPQFWLLVRLGVWLLLVVLPSSTGGLPTSDLSRRVIQTFNTEWAGQCLLLPLLPVRLAQDRRVGSERLVTLVLLPPPKRIWMATLLFRPGRRVATKAPRTVQPGISSVFKVTGSRQPFGCRDLPFYSFCRCLSHGGLNSLTSS